MSLNVGLAAKEQLNNIEAGLERLRKSRFLALQRKVWTKDQEEHLFHLEMLIGVLKLIISNLILDNQPTAQQKRP